MPHFYWPRNTPGPDLSDAYAERMKLAPEMHALFEEQAPDVAAFIREQLSGGISANVIYGLLLRVWSDEGYNINEAALKMEVDYLAQEYANEPKDH